MGKGGIFGQWKDVPERVARGELRDVLRFGRCSRGGPEMFNLRTVRDWQRAWIAYGTEVSEFIAERPGTRPTALYATGFLPPMKAPPELVDTLPGFDVLEEDGTTVRIFYPCHALGCEAKHLNARKIVTWDERSRHNASELHRTVCLGGVHARVTVH